MKVRIGEREFATTNNEQSREALTVATGLSVAEMHAQLTAGARPSHLAKALHPFLAEEVPLATLASLIAAEPDGVRAQVIALLAPAEGVEVEA